ncbi:hypothetical protein UVI_02008840 [Ustilaginoidea virens]|uniref:F-box domain-containing protein n=1 Tax=Ustilaginoidea virens TaxID=1159556 RepID=A0A1B5KUT2_USTVR|nr:hypothetical protein UVI_02008840 [Ustilaginoidea virens]
MANPTMTTDQFLLSQHRRARTRGSFDSYAVLEAGQRLGSPLLCSSHATDIGESKPIYSCLALILLFNLPRELQVMVLSHLSFGDIERLRRTCRFTRQRIPKSLVYQLFPDMAVAFYSTLGIPSSLQGKTIRDGPWLTVVFGAWLKATASWLGASTFSPVGELLGCADGAGTQL